MAVLPGSPSRNLWRYNFTAIIVLAGCDPLKDEGIAYAKALRKSDNSVEVFEFKGKILKSLPAAMFEIKLENGHTILGYTAGRLKKNRIRIIFTKL